MKSGIQDEPWPVQAYGNVLRTMQLTGYLPTHDKRPVQGYVG